MPQITNMNIETGIRYGAISQHAITQAWGDHAQADYGKPHCPLCHNELTDIVETEPESEFQYKCSHCGDYYNEDHSDLYPEEPIGWYIDDGEYKAVDCLDSDVLVIESPYYTYSRLCSPCVPNAGCLDNPSDKEFGYKTYCFGHDWYNDGIAPFPIYRVSDDTEVKKED